jgi:histidinol phosphatase-like PHP family hydrolase
VLTNAQISEVLARAAEDEPAAHRQEALRRASRSALFRWPEEAAVIAGEGRPLAELPSVGPWLARIILQLLEDQDADPSEPPELRQGFLTFAEVRATMEEHPDWRQEVRADLQMHSTYSDGKASMREVAAAAAGRGYEFMAITDHSQGLRIANGMDEEELAQQGEEVAALNDDLAREGVALRVLHGIEMNLSPEGEGDMDPAALGRLDWVLGAFHSKLRLKEDQTDRYLAALRNPTICVLAHPRGRRFGVRLGLVADWERVVAEAVEQGKALEIDCHPDRQDLNVDLARLAAEAGCWISIGTDAHYLNEQAAMEFGLATAIRAGVPRERILNFQPADDVVAWSREVRSA